MNFFCIKYILRVGTHCSNKMKNKYNIKTFQHSVKIKKYVYYEHVIHIIITPTKITQETKFTSLH